MRYLIFALLIFSTTLSGYGQTIKYTGTWTKVQTSYVFDFDLILTMKESNQVEGYFLWKIIHYDENDLLSKEYYESKIGLTAKEYVKGSYDPQSRAYFLKGYMKEDPHAIIGIDTYKLKVDENENLSGTTNANGSWLGRINPKPNGLEIL
jgi:hypothetical protein